MTAYTNLIIAANYCAFMVQRVFFGLQPQRDFTTLCTYLHNAYPCHSVQDVKLPRHVHSLTQKTSIMLESMNWFLTLTFFVDLECVALGLTVNFFKHCLVNKNAR